MIKQLAVGLVAAVVLSGCGGNKSYVKRGEIEKTLDQEAFRKGIVEVIGIGAADQKLNNTTQRRATSRDAAIVQAQYEMLSILKGLRLEGGVVVEKAMETDSRLQSHIDEVIKGAEVVKTEWTNDDGCVVTLRLDKKQFERATGTKLQ